MASSKRDMSERLAFVRYWARYVREHANKIWSSQQNLLIDSVMKTADQNVQRYLKTKQLAAKIRSG